MNAGTVSNLISCSILIVGLALAFWFTEVLPGHGGRTNGRAGRAKKSLEDEGDGA